MRTGDHTGVEEDDGLQDGELGDVDLHVAQHVHQFVHNASTDAADFDFGRNAGNDVVIAEEETVFEVE